MKNQTTKNYLHLTYPLTYNLIECVNSRCIDIEQKKQKSFKHAKQNYQRMLDTMDGTFTLREETVAIINLMHRIEDVLAN